MTRYWIVRNPYSHNLYNNSKIGSYTNKMIFFAPWLFGTAKYAMGSPLFVTQIRGELFLKTTSMVIWITLQKNTYLIGRANNLLLILRIVQYPDNPIGNTLHFWLF